MSNVLVHGMNMAWVSSAAALVITVEAVAPPGAGGSSNRFVAASGALSATASFDPAAPLDLSPYDEVRFWIQAERRADGSIAAPFYLEFFYIDASNPAAEFRWFVPVNAAGGWEQHVIGLRAGEPRNAVTRLAFRAVTALPFACRIAELLAVREEMLPDAELALTAEIARNIALPGLTNVATTTIPQALDAQVVLVFTPGFAVGNRIRLAGGSLGDEFFDVLLVTNTSTTTTLTFGAGESVAGTFGAGATVSVVVPVVVETLGFPTPAVAPSVIVTMLDAREDLERTGYFLQRDSFRAVGAVTVCSVRPAPRAYVLDYQLTARGSTRPQQLLVHGLLLQRLSGDIGLRINGDTAPVWLLAPPQLYVRRLGELAPVYVCIGTHLQTALRAPQTWVRHAEVRAAPIEAPLDWERVEVDL